MKTLLLLLFFGSLFTYYLSILITTSWPIFPQPPPPFEFLCFGKHVPLFATYSHFCLACLVAGYPGLFHTPTFFWILHIHGFRWDWHPSPLCSLRSPFLHSPLSHMNPDSRGCCNNNIVVIKFSYIYFAGLNFQLPHTFRLSALLQASPPFCFHMWGHFVYLKRRAYITTYHKLACYVLFKKWHRRKEQ